MAADVEPVEPVVEPGAAVAPGAAPAWPVSASAAGGVAERRPALLRLPESCGSSGPLCPAPARAAAALVQRSGAEVAGISVLLELAALNGRANVGDLEVRALLTV